MGYQTFVSWLKFPSFHQILTNLRLILEVLQIAYCCFQLILRLYQLSILPSIERLSIFHPWLILSYSLIFQFHECVKPPLLIHYLCTLKVVHHTILIWHLLQFLLHRLRIDCNIIATATFILQNLLLDHLLHLLISSL